MTALPSDAVADLYRLVAELEQRLDSSFAAHDDAIARQAATAAENARLQDELRLALERQTATADILKVIAASPSDAQPVFEAIADSAKRLLGGFSATVLRFLGDELHLVAYTPTNPAADEGLEASFPRSISEFPTFALVRNGETVQFPDSEAEHVPQLNRELARLRGFRSVLFTPLMNQGVPVGMISVTRAEPGAFAADHVQLLQTFADQAVIAIENARLFNETRQALERQTATADVLQVIAGSPSDVQPVFESIVVSANRLIGGFSTAIFRFADDAVHLAAFTPTDPAGDAVLQSSFPMPAAAFPPYHLVRDGAPAELVDTELEPAARDIARARGYRSMLFAPLMNEGKAVGVITVTRRTPGSFGDPHVQLLQMFAAQSVIAIENVRLFNETREALEQQKASADILRVVSGSVADTQPVFDAILRSIEHLFGGDDRFIYLTGDDGLLHIGAAHGANAERVRALYPVPLEGTASEAAFRERRLIRYADVFNDPEVPQALREVARRIGKNYSMALAPMLWEDRAIGSIFVGRTSMKPFSEKECNLLRSFADQAVIAIQNARLFNETREALERQTATAEILNVIAGSPTDVQPVFDAIAESAKRLLNGQTALVTRVVGDQLDLAAHTAGSEAGDAAIYSSFPTPLASPGIHSRVALTGTIAFRSDIETEPDVPEAVKETARARGYRSIISVPMLRDGTSIGTIGVTRAEPGPFADNQIDLLKTFADQAVIAIENVRLFNEVKQRTEDLSESLQQQTATADVLKIISRSAFDLDSVLATLVESAAKLCEAEKGVIFLRQENLYRMTTNYGFSPEFEAFARDHPFSVDGGSTTARAAASGVVTQTVDILADETQGELARQYQKLGGHRTNLGVPLRSKGETIGIFTLTRQVVRPFSEKQIELVSTFADQAVIAIENVRLFDEVQAKTRDLEESLQHQTATSDVLQAISSSMADAQPAFDRILDSSMRLFSCRGVAIFLAPPDGMLHLAGTRGFGSGSVNHLYPRPIVETTAAVIIGERRQHYVADVLNGVDVSPSLLRTAQTIGNFSVVMTPMVWEGRGVGMISVTREPNAGFNDKELSLLKTFADQAVIAIENARLFNEVQQRTRELAASLDDLRTAQDRLVQTEKLASLGQLTAGIAHEIKNPLNFVNNFAALSAELTDELNDVLKPADISDKIREEVDELTGLLKDNLQKVVQHGKRADSIVKNMLLHSREGSGDHRPADINALIEESLNLAYHGARAERPDFNVTLQRDFDANAGMIEVFPQEITRVFLNLVSNGFYAVAKRKGEDAGFDPILSATTRNLGDAVEIRIRDNGTGIPPEVKDKMFNPFFTTKPAGEGTGLGLSMSHDIIVKQHGGTIDVETEPGQFTEFRIVLPRTGNSNNKNRGQT
jgi:GAF domain-containing protein